MMGGDGGSRWMMGGDGGYPGVGGRQHECRGGKGIADAMPSGIPLHSIPAFRAAAIPLT